MKYLSNLKNLVFNTNKYHHNDFAISLRNVEWKESLISGFYLNIAPRKINVTIFFINFSKEETCYFIKNIVRVGRIKSYKSKVYDFKVNQYLTKSDLKAF